MRSKNIKVGQRYRNKLHPDIVYLGVGLMRARYEQGSKSPLCRKHLVIVESRDDYGLGFVVHPDKNRFASSEFWRGFSPINS
jgi:hypothetical protein